MYCVSSITQQTYHTRIMYSNMFRGLALARVYVCERNAYVMLVYVAVIIIRDNNN